MDEHKLAAFVESPHEDGKIFPVERHEEIDIDGCPGFGPNTDS